jgi:TolB-like protein/Tfp pilus assembly protein PilF
MTATKKQVLALFHELKRRNVFRVAAAYVVVAWLAIQIVETIFPAFGFTDAAIRITTIVFGIGLIPTMIFAWAFELTPEGLKKESEVDRSGSITPHTGKKLDRMIMVVLALALGYFAFDKFVLDPARDANKLATATQEAHQEGRSEVLVESYGDKSIAVLAFVNMSPEPDQEYYSDGISEELLNLLSKIPELRVISRSSSFSYKDKDLDIPTIAAQLNVALILEGSVRKAGNRVRITAQLIEARSDTHLWSETYDRELEDIFAVQDEISTAIVMALKENLGLKIEEAPRVITAINTEAYDAYLRGQYLVVQRTQATIDGAIREFEKAISLDPDYALAHAELAIAYIYLRSSLFGNLPRLEANAKAAPHAERAMVLDPTLAEAHGASGLLSLSQIRFEDAVIYFKRAIQINPNYSLVHTWMANGLFYLGRYEEAFEMQESALRLDPISIAAILNYAEALTERNLLEDADRELERLAFIHPVLYAERRGELLGAGGNWANLVLGCLDALRIEPDNNRGKKCLSWGLSRIGLEQEALTVFETAGSYTLMILGRPKDAVTVAGVDLDEDLTPDERYIFGLTLGSAGAYARARPMLEEVWHKANGLVTQHAFEVVRAAALVAIRRDAGDEAGVDELLAAIMDNVRRYREAGFANATWYFSPDFEEGVAAYLAGEHERGLALIAKAADGGFFILPNQAYLQNLYDDPGFAPIRAAQEARQTREREKFLTIVCTDNPYEAVWKPAEGTCERFAAEQKNDSLQ